MSDNGSTDEGIEENGDEGTDSPSSLGKETGLKEDFKSGNDLDPLAIADTSEAKNRFTVIRPLLEAPGRFHSDGRGQDLKDRSVGSLHDQLLRQPVVAPSLLSRAGVARRGRLADGIEKIIERVSNEHLDRVPRWSTVNKTEIYLRTREEIGRANQMSPSGLALSYPSLSTFRRRFDALRSGRPALFAPVRRGPGVTVLENVERKSDVLPLDRVHIVSVPVDNVMEGRLRLGRHTVATAFDECTDYPLGLSVSFGPLSVLDAKACLLHGSLPKDDPTIYGRLEEWTAWGLPKTLIVGHNIALSSEDLIQTCRSLGIELVYSYTSDSRFTSVLDSIVHRLKRKLGDRWIRRQELERLFEMYLIDEYAQSMRRGAEDTPAGRWNAAMEEGFCRRLAPRDALLWALLPGDVQRVSHGPGIQFHGLRYACLDLMQLLPFSHEGLEIEIRYDPKDLSRIYVWDSRDGRILAVPALDQHYTRSLSLWEHRWLSKEARGEGRDRIESGLCDLKVKMGRPPVPRRRTRFSTWANADNDWPTSSAPKA